jgi:VIT1/CCC1 family predicted Fe2+/Mn2+ transporter
MFIMQTGETYKNDMVLGSVDSLITVMSIVSTFHGLGGGLKVVLLVIVLGVSNVISDGISMFSSRYISRRINADHAIALNSGLYTWLAFTVCGLIPIIPFILPLPIYTKFVASYIIALIVLVATIMIGYDITYDRMYDEKWQLLLSISIPIATIVIAYFIGNVFSHVRKI